MNTARDEWVRVWLGVWTLGVVLLLLTSADAIAALRFGDPDDHLRLVQVRDLIAGQGWFDLRQHRVGLAEPVPMHWSRLVDAPLAAVVLLFDPIVGRRAAETVAVVAVPLLTLGAALALVARYARARFDARHACYAAIAMLFSAAVLVQIRPLRIDHHGWQIVCALAALAALQMRDRRAGAWLSGFALAVWLAVSLEGAPLCAAFLAVGAWDWVVRRDRGERLKRMLAGLAAGSAALFVVTRGLSDLASWCDAISPVHLVALAIGAGGVWLARTDGGSKAALSLAAIGLAALAPLLVAAPQCATGAFSNLDPLVRTLWYENILEGLPIWTMDPVAGAQYLVPPLVGLAATWRILRTAEGHERRIWGEHAWLLSMAIALTVFVSRGAGVANAFAVVPLGWWLVRCVDTLRVRPVGARHVATAAIALAALFPAMVLGLAERAATGGELEPAGPNECGVDRIAPALNALPESRVFAPLDLGPAILLATRHSVVATGHHRGLNAMRHVIATFTAPPDEAERRVRMSAARYVLVCPGLPEATLLAQYAPDGLMARLARDEAPGWLEPVALPRGSAVKVYRIRPAGNP